MSSRRGVSLMEVLVSIGVVAIGLMGVATLIPLAFQQAEAGAQNERKVSLSKRAYREFHILGMANPDRWIDARVVPFTNTFAPPKDIFRQIDPSTTVRNSFCIDPRWCANNAFDPVGNFLNGATLTHTFTFPKVPMSGGGLGLADVREKGGGPTNRSPVMRRVSLAPGPGIPGMMSFAQAEELFNGLDDLTFELPAQATLPPVQTALTGSLGPMKRYAEGGFSWMATVVPEPDLSDMYKLSIVVFHQRQLDAEEIDLVVVSPDMGDIDPVRAGAGVSFGGGDVVVDTSGFPSGEVPIKPGEYVMLARHIAVDAGKYRQQFQWYRVVGMENVPERELASLTLEGADWDFRGKHPNVDQWDFERTFVVYVPDVKSVYEKSIRLERSSLWMQQ